MHKKWCGVDIFFIISNIEIYPQTAGPSASSGRADIRPAED